MQNPFLNRDPRLVKKGAEPSNDDYKLTQKEKDFAEMYDKMRSK